MLNIIVRDYQSSDVSDLASIYYNTIHKINIRVYTEEQVNVWAPESSLQLDGWKKKWEKLPPFVASIDSTIVGFTEFNQETGYIDCFYVHHDYIGKGIGRALMEKVEATAKHNSLKRVFADVSITAKPFFEAKGFKLVREQIIDRKGVKLKNNIMEKLFNN